jgi:hypothetical protein
MDGEGRVWMTEACGYLILDNTRLAGTFVFWLGNQTLEH